jgi:hypothetical protein
MAGRRRNKSERLRTAVEALPRHTKEGMLDGIRSNRVIVGAYADKRGGVCPMLAAHRNGGRTDLSSFARAWDRYTGARKRPRPATERELNTLRAMLEASLAIEEVPELPRLAPAPVPARDTGERDRTPELRDRAGWAWMRPFRRLDEYQRALDELARAERHAAESRERELV